MGANPMKYHQQAGCPEKLPEILLKLNQYIKKAGNIDFILHGGDMIDSTSDEAIVMAAKHFEFDIPLYLCLGNHDLTEKNSLERWLELAPQYFQDKKNPNHTITMNDCIIHVFPNHWEEQPYYWGTTQDAYLSEEQLKKLSNDLNESVNLPHLVLTHSPVFGLPTEQTGLSEPYHPASTTIKTLLTTLTAEHKNIKCVLGGHNHLNSHTEHNGVHFITASSFAETPFEFKLFDITANSMTMSTLSLADSLDFKVEYDSEKSYVQGRPIDREFKMNF